MTLQGIQTVFLDIDDTLWWFTAAREAAKRIAGGDADAQWKVLQTQWTMMPGAVELVHDLKGKGYHLNILSNGSLGWQTEKLRHGGILPWFDHVIVSAECGCAKPDREFFDLALRECGATAATSVMIGDGWDTDVQGALAAGWQAIWLNPGGAPMPSQGLRPTAVVQSLQAITRLL